MSADTQKDLLLFYFIMFMRKNKKQDLYKPVSKCKNESFIHSEYIYMRYMYNINVKSGLIVELHGENKNNIGYDLPLISLTGLNNIIKSDNIVLLKWKERIQSIISKKERDPMYKKAIEDKNKSLLKMLDGKYNKDFTPNLINEIKDALNFYYAGNKHFKYNNESFASLPLNCPIVNLSSYIQKRENIMRQIQGKRNLSFIEAESEKLIDLSSSLFSVDDLSSTELKNSRNLIQKIMEQITEIDMKTKINKTKLGSLVSQYGVLKQIRRSVDLRIGAMQKRIDNMHQIRMEKENKIQDLQIEKQRLQKSIQNLRKEIQDIRQQHEISNSEKSKKITELTNAKHAMEEEKFKFQEKISKLKSDKNMIDKENKKMKQELEKQKIELKKTETSLQSISGKLSSIDKKVLDNRVQDKDLMRKDEFEMFKTNIDKLLSEEKKPVSSVPKLKDLLGLKKSVLESKPRKSRKSRKSRKPKPLDIEEEEIKPKRKRGRPKKSTKSKKSKKKKSKQISVRVNSKKMKRKKRKNNDGDLIFNFSLRNLM